MHIYALALKKSKEEELGGFGGRTEREEIIQLLLQLQLYYKL